MLDSALYAKMKPIKEILEDDPNWKLDEKVPKDAIDGPNAAKNLEAIN